MATVYIAPTAQGSADGTSAANAYAYSSLSTAETDAGSGGIIYFTDGTYNIASNITWDADGVTYKSLNLLGAKMSGGGANKLLIISSASNAIGSVVSGFYFEDFRFKILAPSDATVVYANQPKLQYSKSVHTVDVFSTLIDSANGVTDLAAVEFCEFCVRHTGTRPFNYTQNMTMTNCSLFFDMTNTTGFTPRGDAIFTFKDCIFSTNDNSKVSQNYSNSSTNCCFHNMGTTNSTGGTDNFYADPLYVDSSSDLRLRPSSPCIGAGTAS